MNIMIMTFELSDNNKVSVTLKHLKLTSLMTK